ncbi:hypothetical protein [Neobacillus niacini]|uniref:hypothetical protein n=1 Tax=Neobacillus niacini TaxID=86668 RepID=UPI0005EDB106|nr:hypothetical protein [Neobacillus niacini]
MQIILWAFGAMLLLLLIISFLSRDLNLKGKIIVVLAAFTIALGGLATVNLFTLWQTLLILLVFSFFVSYILDTRLGKVLYKPSAANEELIDDIEFSFSNHQTDKKAIFDDLFDLEEVELVTPSTLKMAARSATLEPGLVQGLEDSEDLDVSFLQERDTEQPIDEGTGNLEIVDGYLSEIESMLLEDSEEIGESVKDDWLDERADHDPIEGKEEENNDNDENDIELELLTAFKEAAAGTNDPQEEINSKKDFELQKK